jgi:hypothetical protein
VPTVRTCFCIGVAGALALVGACTTFESDATDKVDPMGHGTIECYARGVPTTCQVGHSCCLVFGNAPDYCIDGGTPCSDPNYPTESLTCDDSSDCSPNVCCVFDRAERFEAHCVRPEDCAPPRHRMCATAKDCSAETSCTSISILDASTKYRWCQ